MNVHRRRQLFLPRHSEFASDEHHADDYINRNVMCYRQLQYAIVNIATHSRYIICRAPRAQFSFRRGVTRTCRHEIECCHRLKSAFSRASARPAPLTKRIYSHRLIRPFIAHNFPLQLLALAYPFRKFPDYYANWLGNSWRLYHRNCIEIYATAAAQCRKKVLDYFIKNNVAFNCQLFGAFFRRLL